MPLQATSGAASYDAFGGGVPVVPAYIEEVFSTYLYTGNGSTQTITNGIDTSTNGGLVWIKSRTTLDEHALFDTTRGTSTVLSTNSTAQAQSETAFTAFTTSGFSLSGAGLQVNINQNTKTYASWTFRKQPKFFDVVTYTGNGSTGRQISHNLGSKPAFVIIKAVDVVDNWYTIHRSQNSANPGPQGYIRLNATSAIQDTPDVYFDLVNSTDNYLLVGDNAFMNTNGRAYVAYLFAHNAGGFGLTGTDNVISCGSATGDPATYVATVNLGWEPQWVLTKSTASAGNWTIIDNMRGMTVLGSSDARLFPNNSQVESSTNAMGLTSTGFITETYGDAFIYIAIRRGPMKVPTSGTSVFAPVLQNGGNVSITTNFPVDLLISKPPASAGQALYFMDRLRGGTTNNYIISMSSNSDAEITGTGTGLGFQSNTAIQSQNSFYASTTSVIWLNFRRAPSFFDEVCYTGNNVYNRAIPHNLAAVPELVIVKNRTTGGSYWAVYTTTTGSSNLLKLNLTNASASNPYAWGSTAASSTNFYVGDDFNTNNLSDNFVMYLFASCAGVSKCFNYTGNGSSQTINCGFTGGARFVLIKRTDDVGDWYVWDTARGIVAGNDPYLRLNLTAAEVTSNDTIDTDSTGFVVNQVSATNVNVSSATYIGLAIA
jgi:hypothetical protein